MRDERLMKLAQALRPKLPVSRPVRLVESLPRGFDGTLHVTGGPVGGHPEDLFCRRVDVLEGAPPFGIDELPTDQKPGLPFDLGMVHVTHSSSPASFRSGHEDQASLGAQS